MDLESLFDRLLQAVDEHAYLTPSDHVDPSQRRALDEIAAALQVPGFRAEQVRALIRRMHERGRIDRVMMYSALHVVAAHPAVADWAEAARLAGEQEQAALEQGGPALQANLASVERHRGVVAFLQGHHEVALDYFSRAFERQHSAENLGNVLCCLLALGEHEDARDLFARVRRSFPTELVHALQDRVQQDPDLAILRTASSSTPELPS
jgi:tetratricopeptide (TPR) repeat protein